jgi:uncharacterized protein YggU (UPF0235/DUF167 family)
MATVFNVRAATGRGSFSASLVSESPLVIKAGLPAQPEHGRANRELLFGLEELLGCKVELLAGATSRRKTLAAECTREELVRKIRDSKISKQR